MSLHTQPLSAATAPLRTAGSALLAELGRPARHNLWVFPKEGAERLSADFALGEFRCRCGHPECHLTLVSPRLVDVLQTLRDLLATPLALSSAYRCARHNAAVGGRARSVHTWGMAADVMCGEAALLEELVQAARRIPLVGGIGRYPLAGFVHVDVRRRRDDGQPHTWSA
jgi:hypothetical protein